MIPGSQKLPATKTFPAGQDESRIAWVCDGGPTGGRWSCPKCVPKGGNTHGYPDLNEDVEHICGVPWGTSGNEL